MRARPTSLTVLVLTALAAAAVHALAACDDRPVYPLDEEDASPDAASPQEPAPADAGRD